MFDFSSDDQDQSGKRDRILTSPAKTFIHVGWPKTATKSLQINLLARHPGVLHFGPLGDDERMGAVMSMIKNLDSLDYRQEACSALKDEVLRSHPVEGKVLVVSDEMLVLTHFPYFPLADRALIAQRLRDTFGPAGIIMTVRNQVSMLASMYNQLVSYWIVISGSGKTWMDFRVTAGFEEWVERQFELPGTPYLSMLEYDRVYRLYSSVFGKENVHVFCFEQIAEDPCRFAEAICRCLGVEPATAGRLFNERRRNPSRSRADLWKIRYFSRFPALAGLYGKLAGMIPSDLKQAMKNRLPGRPPVNDLPAPLKDRIRTRFAEGNGSMARETGLNLSGHGYI